jgi:hypothetical protein
MLSNRIRIQIIAAVIAATALGVGAGVASPASSSERLEGVTVDQAAVARHRALGRLGEELQVVSDSAIIARHRALGRLPLAPGNGVIQGETSSSGWFPWREPLLGIAVVTACVAFGFALTRSGRVRTRGEA